MVTAASPYFVKKDQASGGGFVRRNTGGFWDAPKSRAEHQLWKTPRFRNLGKYAFFLPQKSGGELSNGFAFSGQSARLTATPRALVTLVRPGTEVNATGSTDYSLATGFTAVITTRGGRRCA